MRCGVSAAQATYASNSPWNKHTHTPSAKQCLLIKAPSFPVSLVLKSPLTGEALAESFCRTVGRPVSPVDLITFSAVLKRGSSSCVVINNVASMFGV